MPDPLDLEPIKERLAAAAPAPWEAIDIGGTYYTPEEWAKPSAEMVPAKEAWDVLGPYSMGNGAEGAMTREMAEFIAHAPADVPALIAEVERLREERGFWREATHHLSEVRSTPEQPPG